MQRFEQNSEAVDNAVDSLSDDSTPTDAWEIINSEAIQQDLEDSYAPHTATLILRYWIQTSIIFQLLILQQK